MQNWGAQVRWFRILYISARNLQPHALADWLPPAQDGIESDGSRVRRFGSVRDPLPNEYATGLAYAVVSNH